MCSQYDFQKKINLKFLTIEESISFKYSLLIYKSYLMNVVFAVTKESTKSLHLKFKQ